MIKSSIKQLTRTPLKTILYFLLIVFVGGLLAIGLSLWTLSEQRLKAYEDSFITIGTVEQLQDGLEIVEEWDAELKDYQVYQTKVFGKKISATELLFEGSEYIIEPEFRPYYLSYMPEYETNKTYSNTAVEFTPLEDCIPNKPVKVELVRILSTGTNGLSEGITIWFCDYYTEEPKKLEKGQKYVTELYNIDYIYDIENAEVVYCPSAILSTQSTLTGEYVEGSVSVQNEITDIPNYYQVYEGFYESEVGNRYQELVKSESMIEYSIPVTGTNALHLILPFYSHDVYIIDGREITEEEFALGERVCLISQEFAEQNELTIGYSINLRLFKVFFGRSAGEWNGGYSSGELLNANGKAYDIFEESPYKIVGIYKQSPISNGERFSLADNEVIIPSVSIENSIEENIAFFRPMSATTTSFQIQNGKIEEFMQNFQKTGIDNLNFTFYDMGYSELEAGMKQMKMYSGVMLIVGMLLSIFVLLLFTHLYITNNKRATMIERTLGVSQKKCMVSLLAGVMLLLLLGSIAGGVMGGLISRKAAVNLTGKSYYSTEYSNSSESEEDVLTDIESEMNVDRVIFHNTTISTSILVLFGTFLAIIKAGRNVRQEPLKLLGEKVE